MNANGVDTPASTSQSRKFGAENTLRLLSYIERTRVISQHSISLRLGIAVGLTNAYIKRAIRRGWIRMQKVPARRYAYYLTPKGLSEKSRLTAEYLSSSFGFFRRARSQCLDALREAEQRGWNRVALMGTSELSEIASLAARETEVQLVAVIQPGSNHKTFAGLPVLQTLDSLKSVDAVMITDIDSPQARYENACAELKDDRVLTPALLHVTRLPVLNGED